MRRRRAAQGPAETHGEVRDDRREVAKVGVAGSNPVVRSRNSVADQPECQGLRPGCLSCGRFHRRRTNQTVARSAESRPHLVTQARRHGCPVHPPPLAKRQSTGFDGLVWTLSSVHAVWSGKPIPARPVTSSEPGFGRAPSAVHDRSQFSRFVAGIPTPTNRLGSLRSSRGHVHDGVATDEIVGGESRQPLAQRALETLFR